MAATAYYLKSGSGATERANSTAYTAGNRIVLLRTDTSANYLVCRKWVWECTTTGLSGAAVPTWPASVTQDTTTVTDNLAVWTARKPGYSSGTTANWTFAGIFQEYVASACAGGDTIYESSNHAETATNAGGVTWTFGSASGGGLPIQVLSVNDSVAPPTAVLTGGATTNSSGGSSIVGNGYFNSVSIISTNASVNLHSGGSGSGRLVFENSTLGTAANAAVGVTIGVLGGINCYSEFISTKFKLPFAGNYITLNGPIKMQGCSLASGSAAVTTLFALANDRACINAVIDGCDWSACAAAVTIFSTAAGNPSKVTIRNCKLPASWTGSLVTGITGDGFRAEMLNCDSATTNYRMWIEDRLGTIKSEATVVKTGGSSDGTTPLSWKMVSGASTILGFPSCALRSNEIVRWVTAVSTTFTVDVVTDNVTLTNADFWIDVAYPNSATAPLNTVVTSRVADSLTTATNLTSSSATWTTTGLTTPIKQLVTLTFTPAAAGFAIVTLRLAKPTTTVYADLKLV